MTRQDKFNLVLLLGVIGSIPKLIWIIKNWDEIIVFQLLLSSVGMIGIWLIIRQARDPWK